MDQNSSFAHGYLTVPASFVEWFIFALNCLCPLTENQLMMYVWIYFCTFRSVLMAYLSILMSALYYLDYYSFAMS